MAPGKNERIISNGSKDPGDYKPITLEGNGLTPAYRESMKAQGFTFVRKGDESNEIERGGQIFNNSVGEFLLKPVSLEKGAAASLYKKSEDGSWVIVPDMEIHPLG